MQCVLQRVVHSLVGNLWCGVKSHADMCAGDYCTRFDTRASSNCIAHVDSTNASVRACDRAGVHVFATLNERFAVRTHTWCMHDPSRQIAELIPAFDCA